MKDNSMERRLCKLVDGLKPSSDLASFRNDYHEAVNGGVAKGLVTEEQSQLLKTARDWLETWVRDSRIDPGIAFSQWQQLYERGYGTLPDGLMESFLQKFPQFEAGTLDWSAFILACPSKRLIEALLRRRLVRERDLNDLSKRKTAAFYRSAALDVLIKRDALKSPEHIWKECLCQSAERPRGATRDEVLLHCYRLDPAECIDENLLVLLQDQATDPKVILTLLLDDRPSAMRFARYVTGRAVHHVPGRKETDDSRSPVELLALWLDACHQVIERGDTDQSVTASMVLALTRLVTTGFCGPAPTAPLDEIAKTAMAATEKVIANMLGRGEERSAAGGLQEVALVISGELPALLQKYLRQRLADGAHGVGSPDRALRLERYLGRREVISQLIKALDETVPPDQLRRVIEAVLFNCGVRPIGALGQDTTFNSQYHQATGSGILPGEPVTIVAVGRCLGEGSELLVLARAKVRRNRLPPGE